MDMIVKSESLTSIANAIREKGKTSEQLVFPDGFATAIMEIQSGGVHPQLIVTAPEGSTITAVNGEETVTGVIGTEGTLMLDLPAFGTWTVTATLDGQEASALVYIEQEYPMLLSYITNFTINGVYNENVTISEGETTLATVTLDSAGAGTVTLENVSGKLLVFTGGTSGYAKTVTIGSTGEETVNVYPDGALYWHGREFTEVTGGWTNRAWASKASYVGGPDVKAGTLTKNAANMKWSMTIYSSGVVEVLKDIDLTPFTVLHAELSATISSNSMNVPPSIVVVPRNASTWYDDMRGCAHFDGLSFNNIEQIVPVELIDEKCDILIGFHPSNCTGTITIHKVWLTKKAEE